MSEYIGYIPPEAMNEQKEKLKESVGRFLVLPAKVEDQNPNKDMPGKLGSFLVDKGYINKIDSWQSWGFKYENKTISIAREPIPDSQYNYYIFRLGKNNKGENLFPEKGDETDDYRFLHEANHAYQDYLISQKSSDDPRDWYDRAIRGQVDSNFADLFKFCYQKRSENTQKGLSTWGNVPDYNSISNPNSQNAIRAIEDANELVTMYMWNPKYLDTFLNYVSTNIDGYNETDLHQDRLIKISEREKEYLKEIILLYIDEMKDKVSQ